MGRRGVVGSRLWEGEKGRVRLGVEREGAAFEAEIQ